jgi:hypothetical protein
MPVRFGCIQSVGGFERRNCKHDLYVADELKEYLLDCAMLMQDQLPRKHLRWLAISLIYHLLHSLLVPSYLRSPVLNE